jgi:hypothetical protein
MVDMIGYDAENTVHPQVEDVTLFRYHDEVKPHIVYIYHHDGNLTEILFSMWVKDDTVRVLLW